MITIFCDFWGIFREIFFSQKPILLSLFQQNYFLFESKMPIFCEIFLRIKKIRTSVRGQLKMVDFVPAAWLSCMAAATVSKDQRLESRRGKSFL
jgi:hypothetical protein